jgi:hypothetical protein
MMTKFLIILFLLIFAIIGFHLIFQNQRVSIKVGYCPTMKPYIDQLEKVHPVKASLYPSSQEVLAGLARQEINLALVGRKARPEEITKGTAGLYPNDQASTLVRDLDADLSTAYLLPWKDVDYSKVDLVVITDSAGNKDIAYRSPFLYFPNNLDQNLVEQIALTIQ